MKKMLFFLLALLLCGCVNPNEGIEEPISFYYLSQNTDYQPGQSLIREVIVDGAVIGNSPENILRAYLLGPGEDTELINPFPPDTELLSIENSGNILIVTLSERFAQLSGVRLSIACACITKTCLTQFNAQAVRIIAFGHDLDGADYIEMDTASVLFLDASIIESE